MEPTKEAISEGIVTVIAPKPSNEIKDIYNITSDIKDVLRLEICSLQQTKETVVDCIRMQQQNLSKHDMPSLVNYVEGAGLFFFGWMAVTIIAKLLRSIFNRRED